MQLNLQVIRQLLRILKQEELNLVIHLLLLQDIILQEEIQTLSGSLLMMMQFLQAQTEIHPAIQMITTKEMLL